MIPIPKEALRLSVNPLPHLKRLKSITTIMDRNNHISMILPDEKDSEGFIDAQMAAYAISELNYIQRWDI